MILRLWLLVVLTLAGAFAPSRACARTAETRTWDFFPTTTETRPESAPQVADSHLGFAACGYKLASGYSQAAETTAVRTNFSAYEALSEQPITGMSRAAQRASANNALYAQLKADPELAQMFNEQLGTDVITHMESGAGSKLLNPPGTVWHHPFDDPSVMQLLRTVEHTNPQLQPVLHPGGVGGFGNFYGPN